MANNKLVKTAPLAVEKALACPSAIQKELWKELLTNVESCGNLRVFLGRHAIEMSDLRYALRVSPSRRKDLRIALAARGGLGIIEKIIDGGKANVENIRSAVDMLSGEPQGIEKPGDDKNKTDETNDDTGVIIDPFSLVKGG